MTGRRRRWTSVLLVLGAIAAISAVTIGCGNGGASGADPTAVSQPATDKRDERNAGMALPTRPVPAVETQPVPHSGDAADDPAIWIHPRAPARSMIVATDKQGGLAVYDLRGRQLQYVADGEMNNVDLRSGFRLGARRVALVAASNRTDDTVSLYSIDDRTRRLARVGSIEAGIAVYGLCMYRSHRTGHVSVVVDSEEGEVEQWQLAGRGGRVRARRTRSFDVGGKVEGCVADDLLGRIYVSEEEQGIWRYRAEPSGGAERTLVDSADGRGHLTADIEGLAIASGPGSSGWLVASSQGDSSFAIYERAAGNRFVRRFRVGGGRGIDRVEDTDGIDVSAAPLGPAFRNGIFVAQDGRNDDGNQNFKLVPWPREPPGRGPVK